MNQNMQQISPSPRLHAEALKRMGRGPDSELVHMTPSEVDALSGLAQLIYNKPLPTNPETGLPEANLFKSLLPTVLAIGAGAFLGPLAAPLFSGLGSGALAAGLGTGLASFGGHALGRALTGQDFDFAKSGLAGLGSGLTAGFGFTDPGVAGGIDAANAASAATYDPVSGVMSDPYHMIGPSAGGATPLESMAAVTSTPMFGQSPPTTFASDFAQANIDASAADLLSASGPGGMRTPTEAWDHLMENKWSTIGGPLATAALSGEFDEEIEAPGSFLDTGTPFDPKKLKATRERFFEEGEGLTEEEIEELVQQGIPQGRRQRFFGPTTFEEITEEGIKRGGLVGLQEGGEIEETITALTGGAGASLLPLIASAVMKEGTEEEEANTLGYPTPSITGGIGQPPQPFQGGSLGQRALGSSPYFEGRVEGPGDGMSDNIPFMIAERQEGGHLQTQPAVLSPDEYVMPADVVAMLGNGSSTAGSNQLDQFINNFRMDKYGRSEQPPEMRGGLGSLA